MDNQVIELPELEGQGSPSKGLVIGICIGTGFSILCLLLILVYSFRAIPLTTDCNQRMYSYLDIFRVITFAPGVFNRDQWSQAYDMNLKDRVTTTWTSSDLHAVAFLEDIV